MNGQRSLFVQATGVPVTRPMVRRTDPATSLGAAVYALPHVVGNRAKALAALVDAGAEGLTDFELERATGVKQTSIGKRRGELRDAGWVAPLLDADGRQVRRLSPSGAPTGVWVVTAAGCEAHLNGTTS